MDFVMKGDIVYSKSPRELTVTENGWLVCVNGCVQGVFPMLPEQWRGLQVIDHSGKLVIPGLCDLHLHAPQYAFRGLHMDEQLLDWLQKYAFVEEGKFADAAYARRAYGIFAAQMRRSATTRAAIFATVHREATEILMDEMERSGLISFVGKVNMDRDAPEYLAEATAQHSVEETRAWLDDAAGKYSRTSPVITPRFIPSCTEELLSRLGELVCERGLPVQSHLSENPGEVELVRSLMPESRFYGDAYDRYHLFGSHGAAIMAHCVYSSEEEIALMRKNGVFIAHCPSSNINICSGIAPVRRYLDLGLRVGLGSDVAGGESESLFKEMRCAIAASKMYYKYVDAGAQPLTFPEVFWMATAGGGEFFGSVGSFESGCDADIVVLDDAREPHPQELDVAARLERAVYLSVDKTSIDDKFVKGDRIGLED